MDQTGSPSRRLGDADIFPLGLGAMPMALSGRPPEEQGVRTIRADHRGAVRATAAVWILALSGFPAVASGAGATATAVTSRSKLTTSGIGPLRVGMTIAQAERAAGTRLRVSRNAGTGVCFVASLRRGPRGLSFLGTGQRIARVDVTGRRNRITTPTGARIGDTEARIERLFPGRIDVTPHRYTDGHYLTLMPRDRTDANRRIVFETDGRRVTAMRAGRLPEVKYVEGCA